MINFRLHQFQSLYEEIKEDAASKEDFDGLTEELEEIEDIAGDITLAIMTAGSQPAYLTNIPLPYPFEEVNFALWYDKKQYWGSSILLFDSKRTNRKTKKSSIKSALDCLLEDENMVQLKGTNQLLYIVGDNPLFRIEGQKIIDGKKQREYLVMQFGIGGLAPRTISCSYDEFETDFENLSRFNSKVINLGEWNQHIKGKMPPNSKSINYLLDLRRVE